MANRIPTAGCPAGREASPRQWPWPDRRTARTAHHDDRSRADCLRRGSGRNRAMRIPHPRATAPAAPILPIRRQSRKPRCWPPTDRHACAGPAFVRTGRRAPRSKTRSSCRALPSGSHAGAGGPSDMRSRRRAGSSHRLGDFRNIRGWRSSAWRPAGSLCLPGRGPSGLLVDIVDGIGENQLRKVVVDLDRRTIARPEFVDRFGGNGVGIVAWAI